MIVYLDTSAAMKLLVAEAESEALADRLEHMVENGDTLISSLLLHTELHCATNRRPEVIDRAAVTDVLAAIALVDVDSGDLLTAPLLPGRLRSADGVHLATALRVGSHVMAVYDAELQSACRIAGLEVLSPA